MIILHVLQLFLLRRLFLHRTFQQAVLSLPQVSSLSCPIFPAPSLPTFFFSLCVLIALTFLCVHLFINFQDILGRGFVFYDDFSTSFYDLEPSVQSLKFLFILPFQTKPQTLFLKFDYQNTCFSFQCRKVFSETIDTMVSFKTFYMTYIRHT